jgi:hypothetical protein
MKRISLFFTLLAALCLGSGLAYAQHGHGVGGGMAGGGLSGMHGGPNSHSEAAESSRGGHATSSMMASKNPGGVLSHNTHLAAKLEGLLGISATNPNALTLLQNDAMGFKNFGQFVAAVHVSNNLDIPFQTLKTTMTAPNMSLGKAIQELKPGADSKSEAKKATTEANEDVKESAS